jgi:hypothetical protein
MSNRIYIVGGGPSLTGFSWDLLRHKRVIAINRAYEVIPWAEILLFVDNRFFDWHRENILAFEGRIVAASRKPVPHPKVEHYKLSGLSGIDLRQGYLCHGNNAGYAAINLAVQLDASEVVLLGVDMKFSEDGRTHWHSGHKLANPRSQFDKMLPYFDILPPILDRLGVKVYNASVDSDLDVFEKIPLEGAVK